MLRIDRTRFRSARATVANSLMKFGHSTLVGFVTTNNALNGHTDLVPLIESEAIAQPVTITSHYLLSGESLLDTAGWMIIVNFAGYGLGLASAVMYNAFTYNH